MLTSMKPTRLVIGAPKLMTSPFNGLMSESVRLQETIMTPRDKSLSLVMTKDHTMRAHFGFGISWNIVKATINLR